MAKRFKYVERAKEQECYLKKSNFAKLKNVQQCAIRIRFKIGLINEWLIASVTQTLCTSVTAACWRQTNKIIRVEIG